MGRSRVEGAWKQANLWLMVLGRAKRQSRVQSEGLLKEIRERIKTLLKIKKDVYD